MDDFENAVDNAIDDAIEDVTEYAIKKLVLRK